MFSNPIKAGSDGEGVSAEKARKADAASGQPNVALVILREGEFAAGDFNRLASIRPSYISIELWPGQLEKNNVLVMFGFNWGPKKIKHYLGRDVAVVHVTIDAPWLPKELSFLQ